MRQPRAHRTPGPPHRPRRSALSRTVALAQDRLGVVQSAEQRAELRKVLFTQFGFEGYFLEVAEVLNAATDGPPDFAALLAVQARHGVTVAAG